MVCEYLQGATCLQASRMAGVTASTTEKACAVCLAETTRTNHVTASLALAVVARPIPEDKKYIIELLKVIPPKGPGTELKKLISWFYSPDKKNCKCPARIQKMNRWGPDKCEQRIETILRWLKHSARIAGIPYFETAARMLVAKAINNARAK